MRAARLIQAALLGVWCIGQTGMGAPSAGGGGTKTDFARKNPPASATTTVRVAAAQPKRRLIDWRIQHPTEVLDLVDQTLGELEQISARLGTVLQIRPKAANSRIRCRSVGSHGEAIVTNPRGYYLRPAFTRKILERHYHQTG